MIFMKCDRIDDCMQEKLLSCFFVRQDPKLLSNLVLKKFFAMEPSLQKLEANGNILIYFQSSSDSTQDKVLMKKKSKCPCLTALTGEKP